MSRQERSLKRRAFRDLAHCATLPMRRPRPRVRVRRISVCSFSQQAWLDLCRGHEGLDHNFYVADFVFYLQSTGCLLS